MKRIKFCFYIFIFLVSGFFYSKEQVFASDDSRAASLLAAQVIGLDIAVDEKDIFYQNGKVTAKIYNQGSQTAYNVPVDFKVYPDDTKKNAWMHSFIINEIEPGGSKTITLAMELDNCKLVVEANELNAIEEANIKNNKAALEIGGYRSERKAAVKPIAYVDLRILQISGLEKPLSIDETRAIKISIANSGPIDARQAKVRYQFRNLSVDDTLADHGYLEGEKILPLIPGQAKIDFTANYKAVYPGAYTLIIRIDAQHTISEADEYNNTYEELFNVLDKPEVKESKE